jgi:hypothetical protein
MPQNNMANMTLPTYRWNNGKVLLTMGTNWSGSNVPMASWKSMTFHPDQQTYLRITLHMCIWFHHFLSSWPLNWNSSPFVSGVLKVPLGNRIIKCVAENKEKAPTVHRNNERFIKLLKPVHLLTRLSTRDVIVSTAIVLFSGWRFLIFSRGKPAQYITVRPPTTQVHIGNQHDEHNTLHTTQSKRR